MEQPTTANSVLIGRTLTIAEGSSRTQLSLMHTKVKEEWKELLLILEWMSRITAFSHLELGMESRRQPMPNSPCSIPSLNSPVSSSSGSREPQNGQL